MSLLSKGLTYCRQIAVRLANQKCRTCPHQQILGGASSVTVDNSVNRVALTSAVRWCSSNNNNNNSKNNSFNCNYKFETPSPFKKPGPRGHGYQQKFFDGGRLPRGLSEPLYSLKPYRPKDRWDKKHALFGQNDYIDILGDSDLRPADLLQGPQWLRTFNGNEMQRLSRRLNARGHIIKQLYPSKYHSMWKRMRFLYKKYNWRRGSKLPGPDKWRISQ